MHCHHKSLNWQSLDLLDNFGHQACSTEYTNHPNSLGKNDHSLTSNFKPDLVDRIPFCRVWLHQDDKYCVSSPSIQREDIFYNSSGASEALKEIRDFEKKQWNIGRAWEWLVQWKTEGKGNHTLFVLILSYN